MWSFLHTETVRGHTGARQFHVGHLDDSGRSREERVRVGNEGESLIPSPKGGVLVGWETPNITHGVTVTPNRASDDNFFSACKWRFGPIDRVGVG